MRRTLQNIGIQTLTVQILLGGSDLTKQEQHLVIKSVITYLTSTGRMGTL
jgi:hypothetical protein